MHFVRLSRRMHLHLSFSLSGHSYVCTRECVNDANQVKLSLCSTWRRKRSVGIAPHILSLRYRWKSVDILMPRPLYSRYPLNWRLGGPPRLVWMPRKRKKKNPLSLLLAPRAPSPRSSYYTDHSVRVNSNVKKRTQHISSLTVWRLTTYI